MGRHQGTDKPQRRRQHDPKRPRNWKIPAAAAEAVSASASRRQAVGDEKTRLKSGRNLMISEIKEHLTVFRFIHLFIKCIHLFISRSDPLAAAEMNPMIWHKVAAISGIAALGLGTYGSHGFRPKDEAFKEVWRTASLYHLVHTAALVGAPVAKHPNIFGGLLTAGILAFSGSCYVTAYLEDRQYSFLAPFGGFAFIGAWTSLLF